MVPCDAGGTGPPGVSVALPPDRSGGIRVVRVFSRLNVGGPSLHVIHLAAGLVAYGYETRLVVGRESEREGNLMGLASEECGGVPALHGLGPDAPPLPDLAP